MADLNDNVLESEYSKKEFNIDAHLKYGRYQAIRVWIFGSILGASSVLFYRFTKNILNVFKQNCSDSLSSRLVFSVFGTSLWWYQLQRLFQSVPSPLYIVKQKGNFFSTAFVGSFSYAHTVFILSDPPDWTCADLNVIQCRENVEGDYLNPKDN